MVSHEPRAPLTSIKGSSATLLEAELELDPAGYGRDETIAPALEPML